MRYTRNRQLAKAHKDPLWMWMSEPTDKIDLQRYWMTLGLTPKLDTTFKWHREYGLEWFPWGLNFIEFQGKVRLVKF